MTDEMTPGRAVYESFADFPQAVTNWPRITPWDHLEGDEQAAWERAAGAGIRVSVSAVREVVTAILRAGMPSSEPGPELGDEAVCSGCLEAILYNGARWVTLASRAACERHPEGIHTPGAIPTGSP